jgi:hypothetical protein
MGCPKEFSVQGGMGAALLRKPELVKEVSKNKLILIKSHKNIYFFILRY